MHSQKSPHTEPKKSNLVRNAFFLVLAVIILIGINFHIQNPVLVFGGAITVVLAHLAIAGGLAHIIPMLKRYFHGESKRAL